MTTAATDETCVRLLIRYHHQKPGFDAFDPDGPAIHTNKIQKEISKLGLPYCRNDAIRVPRRGQVQCEWYFAFGSKVPHTIAQKLRPDPDSLRAKEIDAWIKEFHVHRLTVTYKDQGSKPTLIMKYPIDSTFGSDLEKFQVKESFKKSSFVTHNKSTHRSSRDFGYQKYPAATRIWGAKPLDLPAHGGTKLGRYSLDGPDRDYKSTQSSTPPRSPATTVVDPDNFFPPPVTGSTSTIHVENSGWEKPNSLWMGGGSPNKDEVKQEEIDSMIFRERQTSSLWGADQVLSDKNSNTYTNPPRTSSKRPRSRSRSTSRPPVRRSRFSMAPSTRAPTSTATHKLENPTTPTRPRLMMEYERKRDSELGSASRADDIRTRTGRSSFASDNRLEDTRSRTDTRRSPVSVDRERGRSRSPYKNRGSPKDPHVYDALSRTSSHSRLESAGSGVGAGSNPNWSANGNLSSTSSGTNVCASVYRATPSTSVAQVSHRISSSPSPSGPSRRSPSTLSYTMGKGQEKSGVGNGVLSSADITALLSSLRSSSSLKTLSIGATGASSNATSNGLGELPISASNLSMIMSELPSLAATLQPLKAQLDAASASHSYLQPTSSSSIGESLSTPTGAGSLSQPLSQPLSSPFSLPIPPPGTAAPLQGNYGGQYGPYGYTLGGYPGYMYPSYPYPYTGTYAQSVGRNAFPVTPVGFGSAVADAAATVAASTPSTSINVKAEPEDTKMDTSSIPIPMPFGKSSAAVVVSGEEQKDSSNSVPGREQRSQSQETSRLIQLRSELIVLRQEIRDRVDREKLILGELAELTEKRKTDFVLGEVDGLDIGHGLGPGEDISDAMLLEKPSSRDVETELKSNLLILQAQLESELAGRRKADQDRRDADHAKREAELARREAEQGRTEAERALKEAEQAQRDADTASKISERLRQEAEQSLREIVERRREAEQLRRDAEHAKREADDRRKEAEQSRKDSDFAKREAEDRRREADQARRDAEHAKRKAEYGLREAEDRRKTAEQGKRDAECAKRDFEKRWKDAETARREADERRWAAEAVVEDVKRECREPFVVPALMDAFLNVQRLTTQTNPIPPAPAVAAVSTKQD